MVKAIHWLVFIQCQIPISIFATGVIEVPISMS